MSRAAGSTTAVTVSTDALRGEVWNQMSTLVLRVSTGKQDVAEALGMSFGRIRVLRRVAEFGPLPMRELVGILNSDAPNVTVAVDDLESRGLVTRTPHPSDRRSKLVGATAAGQRAAKKASRILARPPAGFERLGTDDLAQLHRLLGIALGDTAASPD